MLAVVLAVALPSVALAAAPPARAELTPRELVVDTPARLTITIDGKPDGIEPPSFRVPGADVRYRGQMVRATIVNGKARNELAFQYSIVPSATGTLEIPPIEIETAMGTARTQPLRATVTQQPSSPSSTGGSSAPVTDDDRSPAEPTRAFVKLELPARTLYVGEALPVKIRAYFRAGTSATLPGAPMLSSDAFTMSELADKPAQSEVQIRGETYLQATWTAILSPAKPFRGKLGVELPVELAYRETARQRRSLRDLMGSYPFGGRDPFGDAFIGGDPFAGFDIDIDSMFDVGPVQRREMKLRASAKALEVVEPPTAGRPPGYGGAVGTFELAVDPPAQEASVGEPITLSFRATGTGNFDRLSLTGIAESPELKTYPVKSTFASSAASNLTGTKRFTQTIVSTKAGAIEVPAVAISFFDPVARKYVTARTQPVTLDVGAARDTGSSASQPVTASERLDRGSYVDTLQPRYRQTAFWLVPGALALLTMGLVGAAWWRSNPRVAGLRTRHRIDRVVSHALADMDRAAAAGDSVGFFHAARTALQARLGPSFAIASDAVTAADVEARLGKRGDAIRSVFERADGIAYARGIGTSRSLDTWSALVRDELARLEVHP